MSERGLYKMKTIARLTGFSPAVLRAWETRHGFLVPVRAPSGHRLYTESDLKVLERVRERIQRGDSIGEIAMHGRAMLLAEANEGHRLHARGALEPKARGIAEAASALSPGLLEQLRNAIVEAARNLDGEALALSLDRAFEAASPEQVLAHVLRPAAARIGELWASGQASVASEHLASAAFLGRMHDVLASLEPVAAMAPVAIVACLPDESHELGALTVALHLERRGVRVVYLGASLPLEDLERACEQANPALVSLSTTREALLSVHGHRLAELVRRRRDRTRFWLGGAGAKGDVAELERSGVLVWPPTRALDELDGEIGRLRESAAARGIETPSRANKRARRGTRP